MAKTFREHIGLPASNASVADSTLLIIDAQNEYAEGNLKTANVESTRKAISDLLETYRKSGSPSQIVHITHQTSEQAPIFTSNTNLEKEFAELAPKNGEHVVVKQAPGSFTGTDLADIVEKNAKKGNQVVLTGYMAHVCVSSTARQAFEKGYDVILAKEAIGDRDIPGMKGQDLTQTALNELGDVFGTVVSVNDIK